MPRSILELKLGEELEDCISNPNRAFSLYYKHAYWYAADQRIPSRYDEQRMEMGEILHCDASCPQDAARLAARRKLAW